jgi:hypothetical protein
MWHPVDILLSDVSEELIAFIYKATCWRCSSLVDFLYPEDGGDTFPRNIG